MSRIALMKWRRCRVVLGMIGTLALPTGADAAGGAHVIDDVDVEIPGMCHLESWVAVYGKHRGLLNLGPACTREAWPKLEIGMAAAYTWESAADDTALGPALKLNLRSADSGVGIALDVASGWSVQTGRHETASAIVPITVPIGDRVRLHVNGGWSYVRGSAHRHAAFYGAQIEADLVRDVSVMIEGFQRDHTSVGGEVGVRWTPGQGNFDLDLLYGRYVDGIHSNAVTLGLTFRR